MHGTDLPDKLSALIRLAVADLETVEQDDRYRIDMAVWHEYDADEGLCEVCFAGAVMANTLGTKPSMPAYPDFFPPSVKLKLDILDDVRKGTLVNFKRALDHFTRRPDFVYKAMHAIVNTLDQGRFPSYEDDPVAFKQGCRQLADLLEQQDL